MSDARGQYVFYHYAPSMAGAVVFVVAFALLSGWHVWLLWRNRTWYFIPFILGCLFEAVGYLGRALSSSVYPDNAALKNPFIMQTLLLLLGPTLYAASIYMVLGRLVILLDAASHSIIKPKWLTKFFVLGDVLSFLTQCAGGGILSVVKTAAGMKRGENIILGGLGIQILFFGLFIIVTVVFHWRIAKHPTERSAASTSPWRALITVLYISSVLILARSIFRVVEYVGGQSGEAMQHEWYLYVFDALPILVVAAAFAWFHPSRVVSREALKDAKAIGSATAEDVLEGKGELDTADETAEGAEKNRGDESSR